MALLTSPVTGQTQTGLTSPTYTLTADSAPDSNGQQYAVTALGGTQTGVVAHSNSSPFTLTYWKPKFVRLKGRVGANGYSLINNPVNSYKLVTRKGVSPLTTAPSEIMTVTTTITVPAGAEGNDPLSIRAALSAHFGALDQSSSAVGTLAISGVM
jgi:hypothetical protein